MNRAQTQYAEADRPLTELLDAVPAGGWTAPSPCADWSAADVVAHMVDTQREFLGTHGVDLGTAPDVAADPARAWREHSGQVAAALTDDELDRIDAGAASFGPALHMDGICRPAVDVADDADPVVRVLARLGRVA